MTIDGFYPHTYEEDTFYGFPSLFLGLGAVAYGQSGNGNGGNNSNGQQHTAIPTQTVVSILRKASPDFAGNYGISMSLGQWIHKYHNCECMIAKLERDAYQAEFGGGSVVVLEDF